MLRHGCRGMMVVSLPGEGGHTLLMRMKAASNPLEKCHSEIV